MIFTIRVAKKPLRKLKGRPFRCAGLKIPKAGIRVTEDESLAKDGAALVTKKQLATLRASPYVAVAEVVALAQSLDMLEGSVANGAPVAGLKPEALGILYQRMTRQDPEGVSLAAMVEAIEAELNREGPRLEDMEPPKLRALYEETTGQKAGKKGRAALIKGIEDHG